MNLILLRADEVEEQQSICLEDRRAKHIIEILRATEGDIVRVGIINGPVGEAVIGSMEGDKVWIDVSFDRLPPAPPPVDLILALPRPASLKKVLRSAAAMGVRRIELIRSRRVEKSYFQSPLLNGDRLEEELLLGLEQAKDTWLPSVRIHHRFKPFVEDELPHILQAVQVPLLLHPGEGTSIQGAFEGASRPASTLLALGPEGGWTDHEIQSLIEAGLRPANLGHRILRVETAMVASMAQVQLMRYSIRAASKA